VIKKQTLVGLLTLASVMLVVGCGCESNAVAETATTDAVPVVLQADDVAIANAVIEPERWSELRFGTGGEVAQVLVSEGDRVAAGEPLLRLDTSELELSLHIAQQDVVAHRAVLEQLIDGASDTVVARAARENARQVAQAEIALQIEQLQWEKAQAEDPAAVAATAQAKVEQLQLQLAQARARDPAPDVVAAKVELARAQIALEEARDEYNKALDRPWEPERVREAYSKALRQAELNHQLAQARLEGAQDAQKAHDIGLEVLEVQIDEAQEHLAQTVAAQGAYTITLNMLAAEVEAARLDLEALQAWENPYLDEASDQEVTQAEARLRQAELAVARLELQLQDAELCAPFGGTVVDVRVEAGDPVSPGEIAIVLATLDRLYARTIDLTELDVARVVVGQPAVVSVDALPDQEFAGVVREIALQAKDYRGDVVYDVTVELTGVAGAPLRWGMRAMVKIQTD
jgi:HlyD family secretion protein